ncbi:MAG: hypothetical protein R2698_00390 [Microthrixaceae bacterium]
MITAIPNRRTLDRADPAPSGTTTDAATEQGVDHTPPPRGTPKGSRWWPRGALAWALSSVAALVATSRLLDDPVGLGLHTALAVALGASAQWLLHRRDGASDTDPPARRYGFPLVGAAVGCVVVLVAAEWSRHSGPHGWAGPAEIVRALGEFREHARDDAVPLTAGLGGRLVLGWVIVWWCAFTDVIVRWARSTGHAVAHLLALVVVTSSSPAGMALFPSG